MVLFTGNKPLQELTNIRICSLSKPQKELEENSTPPVKRRRRRATICYKEPKINRLVFHQYAFKFSFNFVIVKTDLSMLYTGHCNFDYL